MICPPCRRQDHKHCYTTQLESQDKTWCDCQHQEPPIQQEEPKAVSELGSEMVARIRPTAYCPWCGRMIRLAYGGLLLIRHDRTKEELCKGAYMAPEDLRTE